MQVMQTRVYQVLQVIRAASECASNEIKGLYDEIIITIVPSYTITHLLLLVLLFVLHTLKKWRQQTSDIFQLLW